MNHLEELQQNLEDYPLSDLKGLAEDIIDRICEAGYEVEVDARAGITVIEAVKHEVL